MPTSDRIQLDLEDYSIKLTVTPRTRIRPRTLVLTLGTPAGPITAIGRNLTMRLLDNQQVTITVAEQDVFGDAVPEEKRGQLAATSSDEGLVTVEQTGPGEFLVRAVAGADSASASVLITDDVNADGTGDYQGSVDFDLVDHRRGVVSQLVINTGTPTDQPTTDGEPV